MKTVIAGIVGVLALAGVASAQQYYSAAHSIQCIGYTDGTSYAKITFTDGYVWGIWNGCSRPTDKPAVNGGFNDVAWPDAPTKNHGSIKRVELTLWTGSEKTASDADDVALNTCTATSQNGYISAQCQGEGGGNYEVRYLTSIVRIP